MLSAIEFELKPDKQINQHIGSLMHGALMEMLDEDYVETLHNNTLQPFSQYLYFDKSKNSYIWKVNTLNEKANNNIINKLLNNDFKTLYIKHNDTSLSLESKIIKPSTSYEELANKYFTQETAENYIKIFFLTPTTFKTNNSYVILPDIKQFYISLLNKWNMFSTKISLDDKDVSEHLYQYTKIVDYNLRSTRFCMENSKINSFLGYVKLKINGPKTLVSIADLLFEYAKYSGLGAKTALGMGGISLE